MATVDERVAFLDGRVNEQGQMINGIRDALVSLEQRMDRRFEGIDRRFDSMDLRFVGIEQRLNALDQKMDVGLATVNQKMDVGLAAVIQRMDIGFAALDRKMDHGFAWLVGIQLTTTAAVVGTLLATLLAR